MLTVAEKWGCGWIKNWFKYVEGQTLGNILVTYLSFQWDTKVLWSKDDRVLCAFETLLQIQTNFNGIFVNLKLITEGQEAINITCCHKDS